MRTSLTHNYEESMDAKRRYEDQLDKLRNKLIKVLDSELLQEYDAAAQTFREQEARHHKEMHEAVTRLLRKKPVIRRAVKTYVYLVANMDKTQVKIGISTRPERRVSTLATGNAGALQLLHKVIGGRPLEKVLHNKFQEHHIRNEWYTYDTTIEDEFIRLNGGDRG